MKASNERDDDVRVEPQGTTVDDNTILVIVEGRQNVKCAFPPNMPADFVHAQLWRAQHQIAAGDADLVETTERQITITLKGDDTFMEVKFPREWSEDFVLATLYRTMTWLQSALSADHLIKALAAQDKMVKEFSRIFRGPGPQAPPLKGR